MARGKKLAPEIVQQVRILLYQNVPYSQIHEKLGVSKGAISKIANTKTISPAQRMNNKQTLNRTLNIEQSSTALPRKSQPLIQSQKMNDERIMNVERSTTPSNLIRQTVDGWLDIISDIMWNRGGKKAKLKELQRGLIELREQLAD